MGFLLKNLYCILTNILIYTDELRVLATSSDDQASETETVLHALHEMIVAIHFLAIRPSPPFDLFSEGVC